MCFFFRSLLLLTGSGSLVRRTRPGGEYFENPCGCPAAMERLFRALYFLSSRPQARKPIARAQTRGHSRRRLLPPPPRPAHSFLRLEPKPARPCRTGRFCRKDRCSVARFPPNEGLVRLNRAGFLPTESRAIPP